MARRTRGSQDSKPATRSDAYVGLLFISLLAQITGAVFFFLDYSQYPSTKPKAPPTIQAPAPPPGGPVAPAPGGAAPAAQPGGADMGGGGMAGGMPQ